MFVHLSILLIYTHNPKLIHLSHHSMLSDKTSRYVTRNLEILSGEPIITGTRTSVRSIVGLWRLGTMPEEILSHLRCLITHNRVDFERLNLQYIAEDRQHFGIIVVPQKNAYEIAQRISVLAIALTANEIENQLLYA